MKYIALDIGLKRIGVAYSAHKDIVTPLLAVERKNRNQAAKEIKDIIKEWGAQAIVVGVPIGSTYEDEMRRRISHFISLLEFEGDIFYQDEAMSSIEAEEMMKGEIRYKRDGRVDSLAAMIILQRYLGVK